MKLSLEGFSGARSTTLDKACRSGPSLITSPAATGRTGPGSPILRGRSPRQRSAPVSTSPVPSLFETADLAARRPGAGRRHAAGAEDGELFLEKRQTRKPGLGRRQAQVARASTNPGLRPARRPRRDRGLCPCAPSFASPPCGARRRSAGPWRTGGSVVHARVAASAPTGSSMPTPIPRRPWALRKRSPAAEGRRLRARRSIPGSSRSRSRCRPTGRRSKSCVPTAAVYRTCARWSASMSRWSPPTARNRDRAATAWAGAASRSPISPRTVWQEAAREALRQSLVSLEARPGARRRDGRGAGPRLARHPAA